jgi:hypothetical protein
MTPDEYLDVVLFHDVITDEGTTLEEGYQGTLVDKFGEQFVVEFTIPDERLVGGNRFETVVLNPEDFAVTGNPE